MHLTLVSRLAFAMVVALILSPGASTARGAPGKLPSAAPEDVGLGQAQEGLGRGGRQEQGGLGAIIDSVAVCEHEVAE